MGKYGKMVTEVLQQITTTNKIVKIVLVRVVLVATAAAQIRIEKARGNCEEREKSERRWESESETQGKSSIFTSKMYRSARR